MICLNSKKLKSVNEEFINDIQNIKHLDVSDNEL